MSDIDYKKRLQLLAERYNPESIRIVEQRMFCSDSVLDSDTALYVKRSMKAVDEEYTKKTRAAGDAAKQHLSEVLKNVSFEYQGSVMTDTHIKGASDIDLLVISEKFYGTDIDKVRQELNYTWKYNYDQLNRLHRFDKNFERYLGDSNQELAELRKQIERVMTACYAICETSKEKAVKITNQHYHREVDIVTSSWFQSLNFVLEGMPDHLRGINVYNKALGIAQGPDYPFLGIKRINERSSNTGGRTKRMIRFLKNVRTDSAQDIPLTSFEINAICYSIPVEEYAHLDYKQMVHVLWHNMFHLWYDGKQDSLKSVVGDEYVFKDKTDKVEALKRLEVEVYKINQDLGNL